ncbi:MAG TPA: TetR/AcrR family transcriptional regulator [Terriglobales bacterium]|nr:TetR/AcrR family transcriptional regulator [Terriglobales bacterium]
MPTEATLRGRTKGKKNGEAARRETERFEQRLGEILEHATDVFYEKGYDAASMRDLSRATGMSLAGLYYYFESKDRLLYLIQKHTFETVLRSLKDQLELINDPEARVRLFIENHLAYFLANRKAMTVLSHEDDTLKDSFGVEILALKREYVKLGIQLLDELKTSQPKFANVSSRIAILSLFGMINWIYTWHNPRVDADAGELARQMSQIFLHGVLHPDTQNGHSESNHSDPAAHKRRPHVPQQS